MQALGSWRIVDKPKLHSMRFVRLETSKLDYGRGGTEDAVRANSVIHEFLGNAHSLVSLGLADNASLDFNLLLLVRWRLAAQALFKMLASFDVEPL